MRVRLEEELDEAVIAVILANPTIVLKSLEVQYTSCQWKIEKFRVQRRKGLEEYYTIEKFLLGRFIVAVKKWQLDHCKKVENFS